MSESINAEFEAYAKAELGDIAAVSEGRFISPKIQNYFKIWSHRQARIDELKEQLAAPCKPITAEDVTDEMIDELARRCETYNTVEADREITAASVNVYNLLKEQK